MKVDVSTELDCPAKSAWDEVQTSSLLLYVTRPLVRLVGTKGPLPEKWKQGDHVHCKMYLFGCFPIGTRQLYFERVDHTQHELQSREHDPLIKKWDHLITIRPSNGGKCIYRDEIEIDAGVLTLFVWIWANWFYRHRQCRWRRLAPLLPQEKKQSTRDDLHREEQRAIEAFQKMTHLFGDNSVSRSTDPPDFVVQKGSQKIGIEVTNYFQDHDFGPKGKLISQLKRKEDEGRGQDGGWFGIGVELKNEIQRKDEKTAGVAQNFDELWLVIYTENSAHSSMAGAPTKGTAEIYTGKFNNAFRDYTSDAKTNRVFHRIFFLCFEHEQNCWVVEVSDRSDFLYLNR